MAGFLLSNIQRMDKTPDHILSLIEDRRTTIKGSVF